MNRQEAVQHLHDRHPGVIDAPEDLVDLQNLHLEFCWFQMHVCDLLDRRAERALRRCFETVHGLMEAGDGQVRDAVGGHFVIPHLVFNKNLEWGKSLMSPLLADFCDWIGQQAR